MSFFCHCDSNVDIFGIKGSHLKNCLYQVGCEISSGDIVLPLKIRQVKLEVSLLVLLSLKCMEYYYYYIILNLCVCMYLVCVCVCMVMWAHTHQSVWRPKDNPLLCLRLSLLKFSMTFARSTDLQVSVTLLSPKRAQDYRNTWTASTGFWCSLRI